MTPEEQTTPGKQFLRLRHHEFPATILPSRSIGQTVQTRRPNPWINSRGERLELNDANISHSVKQCICRSGSAPRRVL